MNINDDNGVLVNKMFEELDNNGLLKNLYSYLLTNTAKKMINSKEKPSDITAEQINLGIWYSVFLSVSSSEHECERHWNLGQDMLVMLSILCPDNNRVQKELEFIRYRHGNVDRSVEDDSDDKNEISKLSLELVRDILMAPDGSGRILTIQEKSAYNHLEDGYFVYSDTSTIARTFIIQTYLRQQMEKKTDKNYAVVVPTDAARNAFAHDMVKELSGCLGKDGYRIITNSEQMNRNMTKRLLFIMTPRELEIVLKDAVNMKLYYLFVTDTQTLEQRGNTAPYYCCLMSRLKQYKQDPKIAIASVDAADPMMYMVQLQKEPMKTVESFVSHYNPITRFIYDVDLNDKRVYINNFFDGTMDEVSSLPDQSFESFLRQVSEAGSCLVYCAGYGDCIDYTISYAKTAPDKNDPDLKDLANSIRESIGTDCFLADVVEKGIAYFAGHMPNDIKLKMIECFKKGKLNVMFCSGQLLEEVGIHADNLFVMEDCHGSERFDDADFRSLIGRVSHIHYDLYTSVFLVHTIKTKLPIQKYREKDLRMNPLPISKPKYVKYLKLIIKDLQKHDMTLHSLQQEASPSDYQMLRRYAHLLIADLLHNRQTLVTWAFRPYLPAKTITTICKAFRNMDCAEEIDFSCDQMGRLKEKAECGECYPKLTGDIKKDEQIIYRFLCEMSRIFMWDVYEKEFLGRQDNGEYSVLQWYAGILSPWMNGKEMCEVVRNAFAFKAAHPETGSYCDAIRRADVFDLDDPMEREYLIAETVCGIERIINGELNSIYFARYSKYMKNCGVLDLHNDWYEMIRFGTKDAGSIELQKIGYSRETAQKILQDKANTMHRSPDEVILKRSLLLDRDPVVQHESQRVHNLCPERFF